MTMRAIRYYSLFEKRGRRWHQLTAMAFPKHLAVRVFQGALIRQSYRLNSDKADVPVMTTGLLELRPTGRKVC